MYNNDQEKAYEASNRILIAIISGVVIMVIIAFVVIVCARLDKGGAVVKADPSKCDLIDPRAVKQIPREWLQTNCPNLLEDEPSESIDAQAQL